ncbi:MAG: SprB repeat-containing protein, partial [Saprospiraceae bacterium]|nr:SprB repeat-containing protein [Saprospiraceae bacterium]
MVGSPYDGSFNGGEDIIIAKIAGCGVNDFCDSDVMFGSIFLDVDRNPYCLEGCSATAGAGPQRDGGCFPQATVWYTFTPAASRPCIKISVTSEVLIQPQMAVFQDACPGSSSSIPFTCAVGSAGMLDIQMGVEAGVTYYIAVSDATGAEGYFDICLVHSPEDALALTVDARDVQCFERGNGEINLTVTNGTGIIDYDWNQDWLDGMMHVNTLSIGTYSVTVTDENNCVAESDSVVISQPDQLFVDLVLEDIMANNTIIYGDTILAWADASIGNEAISRISWLPANVLTSTLTDAVIDQYISPLQATELIVILEDTMGCSVSDSTYILVSDDFPFYVPNAFAPLSTQAKNAIFRPFFSNKVQAIHSMRVFNRWGNVVYERFDFPGW